MKTVLIALLLFMGSSALAQVNYVLNPSLEDHSYCPDNADQINAAKHWTGIDSTAIPGIVKCIPEYLNTCSDTNTAAVAVPNNYFFWQYPHTGNGMAQVILFYDESAIPAPLNYFRDF